MLSAEKGLSHWAAKSSAFCTTRRVSSVTLMPLFGMSPAVLREAPGVKVLLHGAHADLLNLGGEPAQHRIEVALLDLEVLLVSDEDMVGQVNERLVRNRVRVETLEVAVVAVQGVLDGRPGPVAVLTREPQERVIALAGASVAPSARIARVRARLSGGGHRRRR